MDESINKPVVNQYPFEEDAVVLVNKHINTIDFRAEQALHPFESIEIRKVRLKEEIEEGSKLPKLDAQLTTALDVLAKSAGNYLDPDKYTELTDKLSHIGEIANHLQFERLTNENLQGIFEMNDSVMESISKVALAKYSEEDYPSSIAIFALLTTLNPNNDDFWYRLGIAAQKNENYDLALKAYDAAFQINPQLIGAKLFSVECYLRNNEKKKAEAVLTEAKKLAEKVDMSEDFKSFLHQVEQLLAA